MSEIKIVGIPPLDIHYNGRVYDKSDFNKSLDELINKFKLHKRKERIKKLLNNRK